MILSSMKNNLNFSNNIKRKILVVVICTTLLFCAVFRNGYMECCIFKNYNMTNIRNIHNLVQEDIQEDSFSNCYPEKQSRTINCVKLTMGDQQELSNVTQYIKYHKTDTKCQLSNLVENCNVLKRVHNYVTDTKHILTEELEFPLAFAIKMHNSPEQAEQLLRTIYRPHNVYCIYVDKKAENAVFDLMTKIGNCFENIFVVKKRIKVVYSSINLIEAELECMRTLHHSNKKWKYYINLTGQEFPLKTNFEIVKILQKLNGANDIESYDFPFTMQRRYTMFHEIKGNSIVKTNQMKHSFIQRFQMSKGCAYGTFSRRFIEFILSDDIAKQFLVWLNGTYAPEESAWATLNSFPWAPGGFPREIRHSSQSFLSRAIVWSWDGKPCKGRYVRGICVYGAGDLPWLVSRPELIANKFYLDRDPVVLNCLEEILKNRTMNNKFENLNWHFYNTLPHVQYYSKMTPVQHTDRYLQRKKEIWLREHNITL